jgi:DNA/RNA endonuclease G (NUC1)
MAPCEDLTYGGFPRLLPEVTGTFFICRPGELVMNADPSHKTAQWAAEKLTAAALALPDQATRSANDVRPDPMLATNARSMRNDYVGTGYLMGFLAPPNDFASNDVAYSHAQYLSNAIPVNPSAAASWSLLSAMTRSIASRRGVLNVVSIPAYANGVGLGWVGVSDRSAASGSNAHVGKVLVPTHLVKILMDPVRGDAVAFVIPNDARAQSVPLTAWMVPVSQAEALTNVHLSPDLPADRAAFLRASSNQQALVAAWIDQGIWADASAHAQDDLPVRWSIAK